MKFLVSIVVLGLVASQASARVLRILPAPGCEASSIFPIEENGDEVISILPIVGGGAGASILPVAPGASNKLPPAGNILPVAPPASNKLPPAVEAEGTPVSFLPIVGGGASVFPVAPVASNKLPPAGNILPVAPPASNKLPPAVEADGTPVSFLPIVGGGAGASILPVYPGASNKLPPAGETIPISILPVAPEKPSISLPFLPGTGAGASILPVAPGASNKLPPAGNILPVAPPASNKLPPAVEAEGTPVSFLPIVGGGASIFPVAPVASNKLPPAGNILPVAPPASNKLPPAGETIPISILPVAPEKPSISLPFLPGTGAGASILPVAPGASNKLPPAGDILPVVPGASNKLPPSGSISIPVEEEVIELLPVYPVGSNKLPPTFEIAPLPVVYPDLPAISPPAVFPVQPVAPEADCEQPSLPVAPEEHNPDRYIIR